MEIFLISLPIFLIIFSGWLLRKYSIVNENWVHILNQFAYYVSLPALIIISLWGVDFFDKKFQQAIIFGVLTMAIFLVFIFIILRFLNIPRNLKTAIFLGATVGNTVYMGFPLIEFGFGKDLLSFGALVSVIYLVFPLLVSIFIIKYWHDSSHRIFEQLKSFIKNPLVVSSVVGVAFSFFNFEYQFIDAVKKSLTLLGATASPVALFALGGFLYGRFLKKDLNNVFITSFLKVIMFPVMVIAFSFYVAKTENLGIFTLLSSMPVAVTTFVIAEKFNLEKDLVGNSILVSIFFSFFVIPLIIAVF